MGDDHRAGLEADGRHRDGLPVAAPARRADQGIRAERAPPRSENRGPRGVGDDLGSARHPAQPARRAAARLQLPAQRHPGDRGRDRRRAERAPPRRGGGVRGVRRQRRSAAPRDARSVPAAGPARPRRRLAARVGPRGAPGDESRRRGLGPAGRARGGLDALLGPERPGEEPVTPFVLLDGVHKQWSPTVRVGPLSLGIPRGEIVALLGPSGSGKTTVLRLLAGFEAPDAGRLVIDGEDVTALPPARRRCGMVFQHYALFPHLDVGENVAFGLKGSAEPGAAGQKVAEVLALVGLAGFEGRKVQELSGGQQQRVALARALAPEPRVLLLDEPLSNLDPTLRERTRRELRALIKRLGITTLFVTHEQDEAFDLGDRIAVLSRGRVEQVGTADVLYEQPATLFVATFVGRANVLRGAPAQALGAANGQVLVVRPERLRFGAKGLAGVVRERRYTGAAAFFQVETEGGERLEVLAAPDAARVGERVHLEAVKVLTFAEPR